MIINGHHVQSSTSSLTNNTLMANSHGCLDEIQQSPPLELVVSAMAIFQFEWVGDAEHKLQNQPHNCINEEPALSKAPSYQHEGYQMLRKQQSTAQPEAVIFKTQGRNSSNQKSCLQKQMFQVAWVSCLCHH
jgi:hypothetical protein